MAVSTFPYVERIVGGNLRELLLSWQAEGLSMRLIERRLRDDYDVDVSSETIRRWLRATEPDAVA
jgi:intein-encoded DNA endonuclease-like protein